MGRGDGERAVGLHQVRSVMNRILVLILDIKRTFNAFIPIFDNLPLLLTSSYSVVNLFKPKQPSAVPFIVYCCLPIFLAYCFKDTI